MATADPSTGSLEKQVRKYHHVKAFKNPPELVASLVKGAIKKTRESLYKLILKSVMAGSMSASIFLTDKSLSTHRYWLNFWFGSIRRI